MSKRNLLRRPQYLSFLVVACALGALAPAGCATGTIGDTDIADTDENRAIYGRVMEYRRAMEERNGDALLAMVSRKYYENATSTDRPEDDYGYNKVRDGLVPELQDNVQDLQLRILMRRISVDGDRAWADYEYYYQFKYVEGGVEGWKPRNDFNRLEFVREDGEWKISGGL